MKQETVKDKSKGILWRVQLAIAVLLMAAVLELGKHTIFGWILTVAAVCGFCVVRMKLQHDPAGGGL